MKKIVSLILCTAAMFTFSSTVLAADEKTADPIRTGYVDYELSDLNEVTSRASSTKEITMGKVEGRLFNVTGNVIGKSAAFTVSGLPSTAKITNVQAWNPSKSNITQGKFTALENIQVRLNGAPSGFFKFWVINAPTNMDPCNTSGLNTKSPNGTYEVEIQGRVFQNVTGMDGFTVNGTKVRITYSY